MIRVVIDTGVVVSAAFRDRTPEQVILFVAENKDFEWVVSPSILEEYNEVLARKRFALADEILTQWRQTFQTFATLIKPDVKVELRRDPKDAMFLECAIASGAGYLITGDSDFSDAQKLTEAKIISVSEFKNLVADKNIS